MHAFFVTVFPHDFLVKSQSLIYYQLAVCVQGYPLENSSVLTSFVLTNGQLCLFSLTKCIFWNKQTKQTTKRKSDFWRIKCTLQNKCTAALRHTLFVCLFVPNYTTMERIIRFIKKNQKKHTEYLKNHRTKNNI